MTARHVVEYFRNSVTRPDKCTFLLPKEPALTLIDRFDLMPKAITGRRPDVAFREIKPELPQHLGKEPYVLDKEDAPIHFPYALAAGFPTASKSKRESEQGWQLAMACANAVAEGVTTVDADQIQFYNELIASPEIDNISGMSGGQSSGAMAKTMD